MCTIDFQQVLPGFVESRDRHGIELQFREGNLEALTDDLDRGDVDLGSIMCSPYSTPRRFLATPLFREDYVVAAIGDDHRFTGREAIAMAELDRERYCERIYCEFSSHIHIERLLDERGVRSGQCRSTHPDSALERAPDRESN